MPYDQSSQLLDPKLHEVISFDAIDLMPDEAGCYPREPDKTGTGEES